LFVGNQAKPSGALHDAGPESAATNSSDIIDLPASAVFQCIASQKKIVDRTTKPGSGVGFVEGDC
jgi:hypothetical protein